MSTKQQNAGKTALNFLRNNTVPLMFIIICAVCIPLSGFSPAYLVNEIVTRLGRNAFLILSLLIPGRIHRNLLILSRTAGNLLQQGMMPVF